MSSPLGLMAPTIIDSDAVQGETFLPGQIFVFGGFALRANSLGHLEQIESYAPGHQVRFGSLNYMADIRGDLIFDGFEPLPCASRGHDEYDLALPSDSVQEIAQAAASTLNSEPTWRLFSMTREVIVGTAAEQAVMTKLPSRRVWPIARAPPTVMLFLTMR